MDSKLKNQIRAAWIARLIGWAILFWTNWKFGLAFLLIEIGNKYENSLQNASILGIIGNILNSLDALIKRDDITPESKIIKNN